MCENHPMTPESPLLLSTSSLTPEDWDLIKDHGWSGERDVHAVMSEDMGQTPLMTVISGYLDNPLPYRPNLPLARRLIEAGANVNAVDHDGCTLLWYCLETQLFSLLMEFGVNIHSRDNRGFTALDENAFRLARMSSHENRHAKAFLANIRTLMRAGIDLSGLDKDGLSSIDKIKGYGFFELAAEMEQSLLSALPAAGPEFAPTPKARL